MPDAHPCWLYIDSRLASLQASGADAAAVARLMAGAFASGLPAAKFAASARMMVTALDAEERCVRASRRHNPGGADAKETGG